MILDASIVAVPEDVLRVWVLIFALGVLTVTLGGAVRVWRTLHRSKDLRFMLWGRLAREFGVALLIIEEMLGVIDRLGNPDFTTGTPIFQLALILLLIAWHLLDRRIYRTVNMDRFVTRLEEGVRDRDGSRRTS